MFFCFFSRQKTKKIKTKKKNKSRKQNPARTEGAEGVIIQMALEKVTGLPGGGIFRSKPPVFDRS